MQRSSIIATVVAAGGVLIASSVGAVAVINAASAPEHAAEVSVVAESAASGPATPPAAAPSAAALPAFTQEALPPVPDVADVAAAAPIPAAVDDSEEQAAPAPAPVPQAAAKPAAHKATHKTSSKTSSKKPSRAAVEEDDDEGEIDDMATPQAPQISQEQAVDIVLRATNGGVVQQAELTEHEDYLAWAIRVLRHDGSIVTGYVSASNGAVFDWITNQAAPAPAAPTVSGGGGEHHEGSDDD